MSWIVIGAIAVIIIIVLILFISMIKGMLREGFTGILVLLLVSSAWYCYTNNITTPNQAFTKVKTYVQSWFTTNNNDMFTERLTGNESSKTDYGATFIMGELDELGRSTYAHILVRDNEEPGQNGIKRDEHINVDPTGWKNYKVGENWVFNRTHLVGWQFSGVNDDIRNLIIGTSYLNKGTDNKGMKQDNPDGMLYYEQQLDSWLANHPNYQLDYYVKPIYEGNELAPRKVYMQWVGVDADNNTIPIKIGGKSHDIKDDYQGVVLENTSPSLKIDYTTLNKK